MTLEKMVAFTDYLRSYITPHKQEAIERVLHKRTRHVTLVAENIFQPHNASAVIRTAECFGLQEMSVIENKYSFTVTNSVAMGASKWIELSHYTNSTECIQQLKARGYRIVATTPHANAGMLPNFSLERKCALFFGTENTGLSESVLQNADEFVAIPMYGFTQSFNISVSVAIFLQHIIPQLHTSSLAWQLSPEDLIQTRLQWYKACVKAADKLERQFLQK
jgi:tRNA (guanosine-2'-O-)-methyltransferase